MAVITRQELQGNGIWWTWINYEGYNTFIVQTPNQISESDALTLKNNYLAAHQYDNILQAMVSVYDHRDLIDNAYNYIRSDNPNYTKWNTYLGRLEWQDSIMIRWFNAMLVKELIARGEIVLSGFLESQVFTQLKTWITNTPQEEVRLVLFGR